MCRCICFFDIYSDCFLSVFLSWATFLGFFSLSNILMFIITFISSVFPALLSLSSHSGIEFMHVFYVFFKLSNNSWNFETFFLKNAFFPFLHFSLRIPYWAIFKTTDFFFFFFASSKLMSPSKAFFISITVIFICSISF